MIHTVTERTRAQDAGAAAFGVVAAASPTVLWLCDAEGDVIYFSRAWRELTGQSEHDSLHEDWSDMVHEADRERIRALYADGIRAQRAFDYDYRLLLPCGGWRWVNDSGRPRFDARGDYLGHIGTIVDVHDRVLQTEALRQREQHLARMTEFRRSILALVEEGLATHDPDAFYQRMLERAVSVIDGAEAGSWLARADDGYFGFAAAVGYDLDTMRRVRFPSAEAGFGGNGPKARPTVVRGPLPDPEDLPLEQRQILMTEGRTREIRSVLVIPVVVEGVPTALLTLDSYTSEDAFGPEATEMARIFGAHAATLVRRFDLEVQLHRLAYRDALTGLANRALFQQALGDALTGPTAADGVAVLFVDLDDLKPINDTLGHRAGDDVLRAVAERLTACAGSKGTVARLGGDEFTVLLTGPSAEEEARALSVSILAALEPAIRSGEHELHVGASIGISCAPRDGTDAQDLIRRADMAMYVVKQRGKADVVAFAPAMEAVQRDRLEVAEALRRALERDELEVHYQPRVHMSTGRIVALEGLLRWRHPEHGLVPADAFIGDVDSTSLVQALHRRVMQVAGRDARRWRLHHPDVRVSVNVDARQLIRPTFVGEVGTVMAEAGLPADALEIELLEGTGVSEGPQLGERLKALKRLGVGIVLGGFGNGSTTVSQLRTMPIDTLKIDRNLVRALGDAPHAARERGVVHAVADLARALGARVAATAVESEPTWRTLAAIGVDEAQGYLLSPAVPAEDLEAMLAAGPLGPRPSRP